MKDKKKDSVGGFVFVGAMFMGMALGFLTGNVPVGLFAGLGVGFLAKAAIAQSEKDKSRIID